MTAVIRPPCDEGSILSGSGSAPCPEASGPWVLAATILGSSMVFLDGTVVNVAMPVMQERLSANAVQVQWIVESYALFLGALLLVGGSLGDQLGRRKVFAIGVGIFSLASLWCGLAPNADQLIVARGVQGIGGALLVPGSLAIISASFPDAERGKAIGTWSGFTAITSAIGPLLGGVLADAGLWRWIFILNLPIAAAVLAILFFHVPESRGERRETLDWIGATLATLGLGAVVYALIAASSADWRDPVILGAGIGGIVALVAFVAVESRSRAPMVPLGLFRSRAFAGANLLTFFLYAALSGALFFVPFNLIQIQGYTATEAGAGMLPFVLIIFALSRWSGGLVARYGGKLPLVVGPLVAATGFALFARPGVDAGSFWTSFFPAVVVLGTGMAISVAPLTTVVMAAVDRRFAGTASGINNAVSRVAALVSLAAMGLVLLSISGRLVESRLATLDLAPEHRQTLLEQRDSIGATDVPTELSADTQATVRAVFAESFVSGFRVVMLLAAGFGVVASLCAWFLIDAGSRSKRASDLREARTDDTVRLSARLRKVKPKMGHHETVRIEFPCEHAASAKVHDVVRPADGCEDCIAMGGEWVHLRMCLSCGRIGCCDSSPNRHATKHYRSTGHPLITSAEPGETWVWCFADGEAISS